MRNSCCNNNRQDFGDEPLVINIDQATKENFFFRRTLWTGKHLQITLMSIPVGGEIGVEIHPHVDQFLRIENGYGLVKIGKSKDNLNDTHRINGNFGIVIPAGTWHNVINTGNMPLKLYSVYAPPQHPFGTVHETKAVADKYE